MLNGHGKRTLLVQDVVGLAFALSIGATFNQVYLVKFPYNSRMRGRNPEVAFEHLLRYATRSLGDFKITDINDLELNLVKDGNEGELFSQLGMLNMGLYSKDFNVYSMFERVSIVSGMADLILSIDKPIVNKFNFLELLESRKWRKSMKEVPFDDIYFPELLKNNLSIANQSIKHLNKETVKSQIQFAKEASDLPSWFHSLVTSNPRMLIVNPYQEVSPLFARKIGKLIDGPEYDEFLPILIKPHPSTSDPENVISLLQDQISRDTLNVSFDINSEVLSEIPLEYFFVSLESPIALGSPSSSYFLLNSSQIKLVKKRSGSFFKDSIERANAGPFIRLCVDATFFSYQ